MTQGLVELHSHSTASDGALSPTRLVESAAAAGVVLLALTDHDTLAGVAEAQAAGSRLGVEVVPGIELSVKTRPGQFHLLGYLREPAPRPLAGRLAAIGEARRVRGERIIARCAELGVPIAWDDVLARCPGGRVGRPQIADALVAAGHAADRQDAFDRFLANDGPAYVGIDALQPVEAVELVKASGGAAVVAHPGTLARDEAGLDAFLAPLAAAGLDGLEGLRPDQDADERALVERLAERHGLLVVGGSDFHGAGHQDPRRILGSADVARERVAALLDRRG